MSAQYYIPTPEDFRRGFEFEVLYLYGGWGKEVFDDPNDIKRYGSIGQLIHALEGQEWNDHIRVPYLTAEQIEDYYKTHGDDDDDWLAFGDYPSSPIRHTFSYSQKGKKLIVTKDIHDGREPDIIYHGSCRCINDFRLICKLLNIKQ